MTGWVSSNFTYLFKTKDAFTYAHTLLYNLCFIVLGTVIAYNRDSLNEITEQAVQAGVPDHYPDAVPDLHRCGQLFGVRNAEL